MNLSALFKKQSAPPPLTISTRTLFDAVLRHQYAFEQNNDFTDWIFINMGIGRMHHFTAETSCLFANQDERFMVGDINMPGVDRLLDKANDDEAARLKAGAVILPAAAGAFITMYKTILGSKPALAIIVRDRITGLANISGEHHVIAAMSGIFADQDHFVPNNLLQAQFNPRGRIAGLEQMPLNEASIDRTIALISLNLNKILAGDELNPLQNSRIIRGMDPKALKSLTFGA